MMKLGLFITAIAALGFAPAALAQNHEGHDHGPAQPNYVMKPKAAPNVDHVWSEAPEDHVMGENTAPITVIAYASVTCPHCSQWFINEWPKFKAAQIDSGNVRFVLREYPTPPQQIAMIGFLMANCGPKDAYFDNVIHQMEKQDELFAALKDGTGKEAYDAVAAKAGMPDQAAIDACFADPAGVARINTAIMRANAANIKSVPSFLINGKLFPGKDTSADALGKTIDTELSGGVSTFEPPATSSVSK